MHHRPAMSLAAQLLQDFLGAVGTLRCFVAIFNDSRRVGPVARMVGKVLADMVIEMVIGRTGCGACAECGYYEWNRHQVHLRSGMKKRAIAIAYSFSGWAKTDAVALKETTSILILPLSFLRGNIQSGTSTVF